VLGAVLEHFLDHVSEREPRLLLHNGRESPIPQGFSANPQRAFTSPGLRPSYSQTAGDQGMRGTP
jgi:hypothetical protein